MTEYTIHGGLPGKKRLEILSRTIAAGTLSFLDTASLHAGMHCLDLGCGGGEVSLEIGRRIGPTGQVIGLDLDAAKIDLAKKAAEDQGLENVQFRVLNAYELEESNAYDLVYSRFLLSHLNQPGKVLERVRNALRPEGIFLVEDTDFSGHFSFPLSNAFRQYVRLYQKLLDKRGADANLGQKLVGLLDAAGFADLHFQLYQPVHMDGEGKRMAEITFEGITGALIAESLITQAQADRIQSNLEAFRKRKDSLMSLPRIFQVQGWKR